MGRVDNGLQIHVAALPRLEQPPSNRSAQTPDFAAHKFPPDFRGQRSEILQPPIQVAHEAEGVPRVAPGGALVPDVGWAGVEQYDQGSILALGPELARHLVSNVASEAIPPEHIRALALERSNLLQITRRHFFQAIEFFEPGLAARLDAINGLVRLHMGRQIRITPQYVAARPMDQEEGRFRALRLDWHQETAGRLLSLAEQLADLFNRRRLKQSDQRQLPAGNGFLLREQANRQKRMAA